MDFSNYKFRCSGLVHLMTNGRKKDELFGDTTKTYLRDIYIKETFNRERPDIKGPACAKGTMVESDSLSLVQEVTGKAYFKNQDRFENDFIQGTPDVILDDKIIDIKSSWTIWTFASVDEALAKKNYFYQVLGYMWLTGKKTGDLVYCLVNTPDELTEHELFKLSYSITDEEIDKLRINYAFDDIPAEKRMKQFSFEYDQVLVDELQTRIIAAREYLNKLSL